MHEHVTDTGIQLASIKFHLIISTRLRSFAISALMALSGLCSYIPLKLTNLTRFSNAASMDR